MTWAFNVLNLVTRMISAWLGPILYASAIIVGAVGIYGLWKSADRRSPWHQRKWAAPVILLLAGALAGFHNLMNRIGVTLGDARRYTSGGTVGYTPLDPGTLAGLTFDQAFLAVMGAFVPFFMMVGACVCYAGLMAWYGVARQQRRHGYGVPVVLLVSGSLIARLDLIAAGLLALKDRIAG